MTKTLEKGDLIGVAYNNYIRPAIYFNNSGRSTAQFFLLQQGHIEILKKGQLPWVTYIIRGPLMESINSPIVKLDPADLRDEDFRMYEEMKFLLVKNGQL